MDDLVEKALARWPNVPAIAGWLKLSVSGQWLLTGPVPDGLSITNNRILNFIARNYDKEADGRYFFQNGPQKVYVNLEYTPWVFRIYAFNDCLLLATHTGLVMLPEAMWMDEKGRVLIDTAAGVGVLHSADTTLFAERIVETEGNLCHNATWVVPQDPASRFDLQVTLRASPNVSVGEYALNLNVGQVNSLAVPAQFDFQPNPKV